METSSMEIAPDVKAHNISVFAEMVETLFREIEGEVPAAQLHKLATLVERIRIDAASLSDEIDPTNVAGCYRHLFTGQVTVSFPSQVGARGHDAEPDPNYDMTNVVFLPRR